MCTDLRSLWVPRPSPAPTPPQTCLRWGSIGYPCPGTCREQVELLSRGIGGLWCDCCVIALINSHIPSSMSPMYLVPEGNTYSARPSILQNVREIKNMKCASTYTARLLKDFTSHFLAGPCTGYRWGASKLLLCSQPPRLRSPFYLLRCLETIDL